MFLIQGTQIPTLEIKSFEKYSFLTRYPEHQNALEQLFNQTIQFKNQTLTIGAALQSDRFHPDWHKGLLTQGFVDYSQKEEQKRTEVVLELPKHLSGWIIKKDFTYSMDGIPGGKLVTIFDYPSLQNLFPDLSLSSFCRCLKGREVTYNTKSLKQNEDQSMNNLMIIFNTIEAEMEEEAENKRLHQIGFFNPAFNHLRPVVSNFIQEKIISLGLKHIKVAEDYLYELPPIDGTQPPYERWVVLSKKEKLLSEKESLKRFQNLYATNRPELLRIASEICLLIEHNPFTINNLSDIRFLDDQTNTVVFINTKPSGQFIAPSFYRDGEKRVMDALDPCAFTLKRFEELREDLEDKQLYLVRCVFDQVIRQTLMKTIIYKSIKVAWYQEIQPRLPYAIGALSLVVLGIKTFHHRREFFDRIPPLHSLASWISKPLSKWMQWKESIQQGGWSRWIDWTRQGRGQWKVKVELYWEKDPAVLNDVDLPIVDTLQMHVPLEDCQP